jgi:glycosyltransferase involved in cell wall biosynthesis
MNASQRSERRGSNRVLLFRPSLDSRSGAGQLMFAQLRGLAAAGVAASLACERGALRFWLRTGARPARLSVERVRELAADGWAVVDHGLRIPEAGVVFVHNLATEAVVHLQRADWSDAARAESAFFRDLNPAAAIVANSQLVKDALLRHFTLDPGRILVHRPGFRADRFATARVAALRAEGRGALDLGRATPLIGFVTSGDFAKRGLDLFLDSAVRIAAARPDARFLVVGSKRLPEWAARHPLVESRVLHYRRKVGTPERWIAALDVFLYAARFEEFGLVVAEAQALGVPVVTSRLVGATEVLSPAYGPWLLDIPDPARLAAQTLVLLADEGARHALGAAGAGHAAGQDQDAYARATVATLLAQKRRLK